MLPIGAICAKLLLEAGAVAEPILPPGIKLGSPLYCAARNANGNTLLKYLMTYGAQVDSTGADGNTALSHVSRIDSVRFFVLLLDYNADLNAANFNQQVSLTTAIMYNIHGVLELLLQHWEEFSACLRLKGPHLREITALYADVETVNLLAETNRFNSKHDANHSLRDFAKGLTERIDVADELIHAFDKLLLLLKEYSKGPRSRESFTEKDFHSNFLFWLPCMSLKSLRPMLVSRGMGM